MPRTSPLLVLLTACGSYSPTFLPAFEADGAASLPPIASAGADREILWGYPAHLDATGSYHPLRQRFAVRWQQLEGEPVYLTNELDPMPSFLAPLTEQTLRFQVTADDGIWVTTDEVRLVVAREPTRVAPRVAAGADRYLDYTEEPLPREADVVLAPVAGSTHWQGVQAKLSEERAADATPPADIAAVIHRLTAIDLGLESAPDALLLLPFSAEEHGERAPTASVSGPDTAVPGEGVHLDAAASADPNGDTLRFRWEQVRGDPSLGEADRAAAVLTAPSSPQEVVVRVFASDGILESSPIDASIVVTADDVVAPVVAPPLELVAHAGNTVRIDARARAALPVEEGVTFAWQQTVGPAVPLELDETGRLAHLLAPESGPVALAVRASRSSQSVQLDGLPAVVRLDIVPPEDNDAPRLFLCASTTTPEAGQTVVVTGRLSDPEFDAITELAWSQTQGGGDRIILTERTGAPIASPLCGDPSLSPAVTPASQVEIQTPDQAGVAITVLLEACDALAACDAATVTIETR